MNWDSRVLRVYQVVTHIVALTIIELLFLYNLCK
jgi:hypothetical protein